MDLEFGEENQQYLEDESSACSSALSYYLDQDENKLLDFDSNGETPFFDIRSLSISPIQALETDTSMSPHVSPRKNNINYLKNPIAISVENALKSDEFRNNILTNNNISFDHSYKNHIDIDNIKFKNNLIHTDENTCNDIVSLIEINAQIAPLNGSALDKSRSNSNLETIFEDVYLDTPPKSSKRKSDARATKKKLKKN